MAATDLLDSEWTARDLRPVARWVTRTEPDGRPRLVMTWAVPEPVVPVAPGVPETLPVAGA